MSLHAQHALQDLHTFGTEATAPWFGAFASGEQLLQLLEQEPVQAALQTGGKAPMILGGGSNVLFVDNPRVPVLANRVMGRELLDEGAREVLVRIGAGEVWHNVVQWTVEQGWGGLENLSLIPGRTGAAPMQNIGAYGVELEQTFQELEAMDLQDGSVHRFDQEACRFGYRESVFKREHKGRFAILSITLKLDKQAEPNVSYGAIRETLAEMGVSEPGIAEVSEAVIRIRRSKLPDPAELGNAGSFFKNPELSASDFAALESRNPEVPRYPLADGRVKVPAGWLIEQAGFKGKRVGQTGCHARQALVIVNYGGAKGEEIWQHALNVQRRVEEQFGVRLHPEVNAIGLED
jgi:UDP-N-acetylmuramate dehydrogenase